MKKLFFTTLVSLLTFAIGQAQEPVGFGVTAGLLNTNADMKISLFGFDIANIDAANKTGFYAGVLGDISVSERFHVQPELTYGKAGDLSFFYLPIMAKYYVADKFHLQAGPQFSYSSNIADFKALLNDTRDAILAVDGPDIGNVDDLVKTTAVEFGVGAGYDITDNIMVQGRYAFSLTDRYSGPLGSALDLKNVTINVGIAYKF